MFGISLKSIKKKTFLELTMVSSFSRIAGMNNESKIENNKDNDFIKRSPIFDSLSIKESNISYEKNGVKKNFYNLSFNINPDVVDTNNFILESQQFKNIYDGILNSDKNIKDEYISGYNVNHNLISIAKSLNKKKNSELVTKILSINYFTYLLYKWYKKNNLQMGYSNFILNFNYSDFHYNFIKDFINKTINTGINLSLKNFGNSDFSKIYFFLRNMFFVKMIGSGGFGSVFLAKDFPIEQFVHEKEIITIFSGDKKNVAVKIVDNNSFNNESIFRYLKHPNIIKHIKSSNQYPMGFIVIPYYEKKLKNYIINEENKKKEDLNKIAYQLLDALLYIHSKKLIHNDIKCSNILLDDKNNLILIDFSVSYHILKINETSTYPRGTLVYKHPSIIDTCLNNKNVTFKDVYENFENTERWKKNTLTKDDIWSAGVIINFLFNIDSYKKFRELDGTKEVLDNYQKNENYFNINNDMDENLKEIMKIINNKNFLKDEHALENIKKYHEIFKEKFKNENKDNKNLDENKKEEVQILIENKDDKNLVENKKGKVHFLVENKDNKNLDENKNKEVQNLVKKEDDKFLDKKRKRNNGL